MVASALPATVLSLIVCCGNNNMQELGLNEKSQGSNNIDKLVIIVETG